MGATWRDPLEAAAPRDDTAGMANDGLTRTKGSARATTLVEAAIAGAGRDLLVGPVTDPTTDPTTDPRSDLAADPGADLAADPGAAATGPGRLALLLVDVARAGELQRDLGTDAVDRLLAVVAERMSTALRPQQRLARLEGATFAVVLTDVDVEVAERIAQAMLATLDDPVEIAPADGPGGIGHPVRGIVRVAASVGIATGRLDDDPAVLVGQAEVAVQRAKRSGGGIGRFDAAAVDRTTHRPPMGALREALEHGDLEVHLQPQVDLATGRVRGAEALARWRHPDAGVLLPASFLPLAAQTGLMRPTAQRLLERAVTACRQWWDAGHEVPVSLNLSVSDLLDPEVTRDIPARLQAAGLPARALRIEITEDVFLSDADVVSSLLDTWHAAGVVVALDDFGTGYSSLAYLRRLPIGELKLDQVFVRDLARPTTATIVRHTIAMAHDLGMEVVAEGVEDRATADTLVGMGCDIGQGLLFGGAMPVHEFMDHLASHR